MSATQLILIALIVLAFGFGWLARGRRERANRDAGSEAALAEFDRALGAALTAFQAALGLWQLEGDQISPLGRQALATFERRRVEAWSQRNHSARPAALEAAAADAIAAIDSMAVALAPYGDGRSLQAEQHQRVTRAERSLATARHALLRGAMHAKQDRSR